MHRPRVGGKSGHNYPGFQKQGFPADVASGPDQGLPIGHYIPIAS